MSGAFTDGFSEAARVLDVLRRDDTVLSQLVSVSDAVHKCLSAGNKVLVCGNGGSLADAVHFAEEWTGRFRQDRRPYPVMALAEAAHITCTANDYGFDQVFSRQVEAFGRPGDVLLLLTTSGNSENLLTAAATGRSKEMAVVGFLGRGGGALRDACDIGVVFPGDTSDRIQELHMLSLHLLIQSVEAQLGH